jgi:hypothetical protein
MFHNPKRRAIKVLNSLLTELDTISNVNQGNTWKASLKDVLDLYIGAESSISNRLAELYFTRKESSVVPGVIGIFYNHIYDESKKDAFKTLVKNAINYINSNGVHKTAYKGNFLGVFTTSELIGGIVGAIVIVFGIGNYFGKLERDREIIQYEERIKEGEQRDIESRKEIEALKHQISSLSQGRSVPIKR